MFIALFWGEDMKICLKCGYPIGIDAKFCKRCGYARPETIDQSQAETPIQRKNNPVNSKTFQEDESKLYRKNVETVISPPKKKRSTVRVVALAIVLLTILVTATSYYLYQRAADDAFIGIKSLVDQANYSKSREDLRQYLVDYPYSRHTGEAKTLLKFIDSETEKAAAEEAEEERIRSSSIKLNLTRTKVELGDTIQLTASLLNTKDQTVLFSSSNLRVASVNDEGVVECKEAGSAIITARNSDNKTDTCEITVFIAEPHPTPTPKPTVTPEPTMDVQKEITIYQGDTLKIDVITSNMAANTINYRSNNTSIAKVDKNGNVTGIKPGETKITVTSTTGLNAVCRVTVLEKVKRIEYEWEYPLNLFTWTYTLDIPFEVYDMYNQVDRRSIYGYEDYVTEPSDDAYMGSLVQVFMNAAEEEGFSDWETIHLVISFVQQLEYIEDIVGTGFDEYPKYPLETLYDRGGDCEDTSILLASLLLELDYGTVLIAFDDHMGVGIKGGDGLSGYYFTSYDTKYYYIETTNEGWEIGDMPEDYIDEKATILDLFG